MKCPWAACIKPGRISERFPDITSICVSVLISVSGCLYHIAVIGVRVLHAFYRHFDLLCWSFTAGLPCCPISKRRRFVWLSFGKAEMKKTVYYDVLNNGTAFLFLSVSKGHRFIFIFYRVRQKCITLSVMLYCTTGQCLFFLCCLSSATWLVHSNPSQQIMQYDLLMHLASYL